MTKEEPDQYLLDRKKKRRRIILAVVLSVLLVIGLFALKIVLICTAKPTISIDYAVELNRISKPTNYDANQDAAFDYQKAIQAFVEKPFDILNLRKQRSEQLSDSEKASLNTWLADNQEALENIERSKDCL